MEVIKLSVELTDIYNRGEYKQLLTNISKELYDSCDFKYELWIITTNTSSTYVNTIAQELNIPEGRVILCVDNSTKVGQIVLNSDIHLDGDQTIITALNNTRVHGILVDNKIAYEAIGLKYVKDLDKWTQVILRERFGGNCVPESC